MSLPAGTFLFSADPILIAVAAWDPVFAALVAVAVVALFVSASVTADAMLVSPLEMTLSALVDAASVLDRSGRMRGAPAKERVDLIQAVRRILAHLSNSFGGVAADRRRSMPLRHSFSDRGSVPGSILSGNPLDTGAVVAASGRASSDAARLALSGGGDASDARNVISSARPAPRARAVSEDRAKPSMRFAPAVLNHLGTNRWNPWLSGPELVSACHIMFIKSRVPESICKKDSFVAFAERALDKHPDLRFHSKR